MIGALIARDLRRGFSGGAWLPIAFYLLIAMLAPFAVGPDAQLLARIAPGMLWIAALLASLLPVERLVEPDRADGTLDQLRLHGLADESVAAAKIAAHWLGFAPLLLGASIPAAALLGLPSGQLGQTLLALALATPALAALAVAAASLTSGLARAGSLAGLLVIPIAVPLLIFGAAASGERGSSALLLEGAIALLVTAGAPFVAAAAIRASRT